MAEGIPTQSKVGGATASGVLLFGTPADTLWAIGARGAAEPTTMTHHTDWSHTALSITAAALPPTV
jgi:hypothetical protein